jgi:hypothetical protein
MHNVVQTHTIESHNIEIAQRATLVAFSGFRTIHTSSEFYEYVLRINGNVIKPPSFKSEEAQNGQIVNWRSTGFDTPENALRWAEYLIENETEEHRALISTN